MSDTATSNPAATAAPLKGGIVPYLMLDGADEAIAFYQRAFDATAIGEPHRMEDGRIMNARIDVNDGSIMLMDPMPEHGYPAVPPQAFNLHLHVESADHWFDRAVSAGCTVIMPVSLQFWGERYGMVKDPYGVTWAFGSKPA